MKNEGLYIYYGIHSSPLGLCLIAVLQSDICAIAFIDKKDAIRSEKEILADLQRKWPEAGFKKDQKKTAPFANRIFDTKKSDASLGVVIKGTDFQMKVWEALISIPKGKTKTYAQVAKQIGRPKAVRAVGTACGKNDIAVLIPCHRVLASDGGLGGYRWGLERKGALLAEEASL